MDEDFTDVVVAFDVLEVFEVVESGRVIELEVRDVDEILELLTASTYGFKTTEFLKL